MVVNSGHDLDLGVRRSGDRGPRCRVEVVPLQQTTRVPREVDEQLHMLTTVTGVPPEEHLRRAVRLYLESAGREAEVAALVDRARGRLRRVLDRLGDL